MNDKSPSHISTGGGAAVEGSVAANRDFIGRDRIEINVIYLNPPTVATNPQNAAANGLHLLNFTWPITPAQQETIAEQLGQAIDVIYEIKVEFDDNRPYGPQCVKVLDQVPLTNRAWQTTPLAVNLPGIAPGAACLLSEMHGRMGHFPTVVRLRRQPENAAAAYVVAEVINLQAQRDKARQRAKSNQ